jgi:ABC-type antimicrobial peptide transport system permease subunit
VSLIVGGIGIMNIMLVSVIERTKEIGLRKSVGATNRDILQQFLVESVMLTFIGGIIGIAIGGIVVGLAWLVITKIAMIAWTFEFPLSAILLAVAVSSITGIAFGIYPAQQAARKSPIEALRYE